MPFPHQVPALARLVLALVLHHTDTAAWRRHNPGGVPMSTNGGTAHEHASPSAAGGHAPADREALMRTLLDLCAQGAVLFSTWFLL